MVSIARPSVVEEILRVRLAGGRSDQRFLYGRVATVGAALARAAGNYFAPDVVVDLRPTTGAIVPTRGFLDPWSIDCSSRSEDEKRRWRVRPNDSGVWLIATIWTGRRKAEAGRVTEPVHAGAGS